MPTAAQGSLPQEQQQAVPGSARNDHCIAYLPLVVTTAGYRSANQSATAEDVDGIFRDYDSIHHQTRLGLACRTRRKYGQPRWRTHGVDLHGRLYHERPVIIRA
ncbi:hypothetical protein HN011_004078 [Eciton burchellii]|nr:hypothetical protein HN011_004078 [Eciton burchellii]